MRCSVVLPTYNRQESLIRTLNALTRQTLSNAEFEVVVVSDGSTDSTDLVLSEFATSKRLILKWFSQENAGPAAARNVGIEMARGDVVVFIDDDVEPVPEFLERHLAHHETDDRMVVVGPLSPDRRWIRDEPVWVAWEHEKLQTIYKMFKPGGKLAGRDPRYVHFYSGNASVRRKWLIEVGGFNPEFRRQEDVELASRLKSICGVRFVWDFEADGLHHPIRSLASWLEIPTAYGVLDAARVHSNSLDPREVDMNIKQRHGLTRFLSWMFRASPSLSEPTSKTLCSLAISLYTIGARTWSLDMLSGVYNARYALAYRRCATSQNSASPIADT